MSIVTNTKHHWVSITSTKVTLAGKEPISEMYNGNTTFFLNYVNQALIGLVVIYNLKLSALFIGYGNVRSDACASHTGVSRSQHSQPVSRQPYWLCTWALSRVTSTTLKGTFTTSSFAHSFKFSSNNIADSNNLGSNKNVLKINE